MQIFIDDDLGYQTWIETYPTGYVLNVPRRATASTTIVLHRPTCGHINGGNLKYTSTTFYKVCGMERERLLTWARTQPRDLKTCHDCAP